MSQFVDALVSAAAAEIAVCTSLKAKLDAAITANVSMQQQVGALTTERDILKGQLATAVANQADPADAARIATVTQQLTDSAAANSPSN